ncbi:hypothetical protein XENOCAPTIV_003324 [Xenoophorus captivus]|uniref:Heterochromatin protein 1-binding protein 3 n=1 Tax=Xenoophorus captivus TaxID=1517983 RepID=A0ABV0RYH4_9TELE
MPIRRAAATPTQEKAPSAAAEKEPEASSEDSPPADEEQAASSAAPAEGEEGETSGDGETKGKTEKAEGGNLQSKEQTEGGKEHIVKCQDCAAGQCSTHCYVLLLRMKDGFKYKKSKSKKMKRTIPAWASITTSKNIPVTNFAGTQNKVDSILVEAIGSSNERSGMSFQSVMKYMLKKYPGMELNKQKFRIKKAMKKHLEKGTIKQLKGKGLSGTFAIGKQPPPSKVCYCRDLSSNFKLDCSLEENFMVSDRLSTKTPMSINFMFLTLEHIFSKFYMLIIGCWRMKNFYTLAQVKLLGLTSYLMEFVVKFLFPIRKKEQYHRLVVQGL